MSRSWSESLNILSKTTGSTLGTDASVSAIRRPSEMSASAVPAWHHGNAPQHKQALRCGP